MTKDKKNPREVLAGSFFDCMPLDKAGRRAFGEARKGGDIMLRYILAEWLNAYGDMLVNIFALLLSTL